VAQGAGRSTRDALGVRVEADAEERAARAGRRSQAVEEAGHAPIMLNLGAGRPQPYRLAAGRPYFASLAAAFCRPRSAILQ
jgi:hypothetical protein